MTKILRAGQDTWALQAALKGQQVLKMIRDGESESAIWWATLVATHRANHVIRIEARLRRYLPRKSCPTRCVPQVVCSSVVSVPQHIRRPGRRKVYD